MQWPVTNVRLDLFGDARPNGEGDVIRRLMGFAGGDKARRCGADRVSFDGQSEARVVDMIKKQANEKDALNAHTTRGTAHRIGGRAFARGAVRGRCSGKSRSRRRNDTRCDLDTDIRALLWLAA